MTHLVAKYSVLSAPLDWMRWPKASSGRACCYWNHNIYFQTGQETSGNRLSRFYDAVSDYSRTRSDRNSKRILWPIVTNAQLRPVTG